MEHTNGYRDMSRHGDDLFSLADCPICRPKLAEVIWSLPLPVAASEAMRELLVTLRNGNGKGKT